ncbi:DgyrCDS11498 [Dimorphilus gyrociliatus]|uniref:DgyrCDS11498 n=1 Tax=Dimorphilus gyrociliatus TaxID=2664684 RepID=A0A7I8W625_9ANNE|nr:DgyrCDS11498 [Dimorphilus gyrociliatus]
MDDSKLLESTAFENSAASIFNIFDSVMENSENVDEAIKTCQRAGRMHSRIQNFDVAYFKDMEGTYIEACKNVLGDRFTEATEKNFRLLYGFVVQHMIDGLQATKSKVTTVDANRI